MKIERLKKEYNGTTVLDIENLTFEMGKSYALSGENGSGKSTLLKLIADIEKPTEGKIDILEKQKVGYLPQKPYPFNMTVMNNILASQEKRDKVKALLLLDEYGLTDLKAKRATKLSGGETQRLCLARLLQNKYDILLLDEFTAAIDREKQAFFNLKVKEYQEKHNCLLIFASHNSEQIGFLADYEIKLEKGKIKI